MGKRKENIAVPSRGRRSAGWSQAIQDYAKTIYKLEKKDGSASTTDIARSLDVSPASVSGMIKRMSGLNLVRHESYRGVTLTAEGRRVALEVIRHHRLLETYLKEVMGYPWEKIHEEAEHLEHHISEEFESRLEEMLGYPTHDPHGHPIPTRDGSVPEAITFPLTNSKAGDIVAVHHVSDADPKLLGYLEQRGLMPEAVLLVESRAAHNGPLTVRVGSARHVLGYELAGHIFVVAVGK